MPKRLRAGRRDGVACRGPAGVDPAFWGAESFAQGAVMRFRRAATPRSTAAAALAGPPGAALITFRDVTATLSNRPC